MPVPILIVKRDRVRRTVVQTGASFVPVRRKPTYVINRNLREKTTHVIDAQLAKESKRDK
jgi:hypothetical protein